MEGTHQLIPAYFAFKHLTKNNSGELVEISEKKTLSKIGKCLEC